MVSAENSSLSVGDVVNVSSSIHDDMAIDKTAIMVYTRSGGLITIFFIFRFSLVMFMAGIYPSTLYLMIMPRGEEDRCRSYWNRERTLNIYRRGSHAVLLYCI